MNRDKGSPPPNWPQLRATLCDIIQTVIAGTRLLVIQSRDEGRGRTHIWVVRFFFGEQDGVMELTQNLKAEEMSILEPKPRRRSGGPRTAHGKSKSSQNSRTHMIFIGEVLPEEENGASLLYDGIRAELRLEGPMELRICRELVQNDLQARRIEKFAVQEAIKARTLALLDVDERGNPVWLPIPKEHESEPGYSTRMRPEFCAVFLKKLKCMIENRGPRPDEDLDFLRSIYGNRMTDIAKVIVVYFQILKTREHLAKADQNTKVRGIVDYEALIFEAIESEIQVQEMRQTLENIRESYELTSDSVVLPPPDVGDRIERYRTANMRKRGRLLAILETIRRLKKEA